MSRFFLSVLFILIVAAFALPYGFGILAQNQFEKMIDEFNNNAQVQLSVTDYQRGWLQSTGTLTLKLILDPKVKEAIQMPIKNANGDLEFSIKEVVKHGPFIFDKGSIKIGQGYVDTVLTLPKDTVDSIKKQWPNFISPQLVGKLLIRLTGASDLEIALKPFQVKRPNNQFSFTTQGMSASYHFSKDMVYLLGEARSDGFKMLGVDNKGIPYSIVVGSLLGKYQTAGHPDYPWLGESTAKLPSLDIKNNQKRVFYLSPVDFSMSFDLVRNLLEMDFGFEFEKLITSTDEYGPVKYNLVLSNLDPKSFHEMIGELKEKNANATTEAERQAVAFSLLPKLMNVLSKGAKLELREASVQFSEGKASASGHLALPEGKMSLMSLMSLQGAFDLKCPKTIIKKLLAFYEHKRLVAHQEKQLSDQHSVQGALTNELNSQTSTEEGQLIPLTDAQMWQRADVSAAQQLVLLVQQNILQEKGQYYVVKVTLKQGQVAFNGKLMPISLPGVSQ